MRHNEEEIQMGILLFQKLCSDAVRNISNGGLVTWSGTVCEGGGWSVPYTMNEDLMTPLNVATKLNLTKILAPARKAYQKEILEKTKKFLEVDGN